MKYLNRKFENHFNKLNMIWLKTNENCLLIDESKIINSFIIGDPTKYSSNQLIDNQINKSIRAIAKMLLLKRRIEESFYWMERKQITNFDLTFSFKLTWSITFKHQTNILVIDLNRWKVVTINFVDLHQTSPIVKSHKVESN